MTAVCPLAACLPGDEDFAREFFEQVVLLERSVQDIARFRVTRKLPLLFDLLETVNSLPSPFDYVIYTNTDICVMPGFYLLANALADLGFDAITINRRCLAHYSYDPLLRPLLMAELGSPHGGFDCFIISSDLIQSFKRSDACIGAGWVMRSLIYNMVALSRRMLMVTDVHATYHLGNDESWNQSEFQDYIDFNLENARQVLDYHAQFADRHRRLKAFCTNHGEPLVLDTDVGKPSRPYQPPTDASAVANDRLGQQDLHAEAVALVSRLRSISAHYPRIKWFIKGFFTVCSRVRHSIWPP